MPIARLPILLVNQIAAGEVIERPASVVKELVENSLDAGAAQVDVRIEDGGRQLIEISDDGMGIPEAELLLAVEPHATSKLQSAAQLEAIATLGFRGEALASIASISRLRIVSRPRDEQGQLAESAALLEVTGGEISGPRPEPAGPGTTLSVRDLFFNTPARRKFMRAAPTEFGHINETLSRIAMMHPEVGFRLRHGDRTTFDLPPHQTRRQRCVALLGKELDEALLEFELDEPERDGRPGASIWGLAGLPVIARATSKFQYLAVNGRPIRDRNLSHAVKEAYRGLIPPDKHPVAIVFIETDPHAVDVNVHPAKAEVRFRDPSRMHGLVLAALRQRLLATDLTPSAALTRPGVALHHEPAPTTDFDWSLPPTSAPENGTEGARQAFQAPAAPRSPGDFVTYFRNMDPSQKGFVYDEVKREMEAQPPGAPRPMADAWTQAAAQSGRSELPPPVLRRAGVLQVHSSYLVTEDDSGLVIIDQHALHERVMFEELRQRILEGPLESQRLLMPATMPANPRRMDVLEQLQPLLTKIGVDASPLGPGSIGIHAFPTLLFDRKVEPVEFLTEVLDRAEDGQLDINDGSQEEAVLHEVLDMMSCKAAVKAGDSLTPEELAALLARREEIERASNCPHGRPTTIRLTLRDLEKHFKRG